MKKSEGKKRSALFFLFDPFEKFTGLQSLVIGLIVIILTSALGALNKGHFDGVLDFHFGKPAPFWYYIYEGFVNLFSISIFLLLGNYILKRKWNTIDTIGYQALARFPAIFIALIPFSAKFRSVSAKIAAYPRNIDNIVSSETSDFVLFTILAFVTIMLLLWMIWLMYVGFSKLIESTWFKKIIVFIISLILAEVLSKTILTTSFNAL